MDWKNLECFYISRLKGQIDIERDEQKRIVPIVSQTFKNMVFIYLFIYLLLIYLFMFISI